MKWTKPSIRLLSHFDSKEVLRQIEYACRTCYQSYDKIGEGSAEKLIKNCLARGHESVIEHVQLSFEVVCSRACLAQWTRHRLSSYSVMSQRYCNYANDKFGGEIECIVPSWWTGETDNNDEFWGEVGTEEYETFCRWQLFYDTVDRIEKNYLYLVKRGMKPEDARGILPNCAATKMVWSANIREIRHFIKVRTCAGAQSEIKQLALDLVELMRQNGLGVLIEDLV